MRAVVRPTHAHAGWIGHASFDGYEAGKVRADGKPFRSTELGAAHWTLPLGTQVRVTDFSSGRSIVVPIMDRGPHPRLHGLIDLSLDAARQLGITRKGVTRVQMALARRLVRNSTARPAKDAAP